MRIIKCLIRTESVYVAINGTADTGYEYAHVSMQYTLNA